MVEQLKIKLLGAAPTVARDRPRRLCAVPAGPRAHAAVHRRGVRAVHALYKQALAIDPSYAPGVGRLAHGYFATDRHRRCDRRSRCSRLAREATEKALAIDPDYAPAHARRGLIAGAIEGDLATAARHLEQALALDPANPDLIGAGVMIARRLGRLDAGDRARRVRGRARPGQRDGHVQPGLSPIVYAGRSTRLSRRSAPGSASVQDPLPQHTQLGEALLMKGDAKAASAECKQEPIESWRLSGCRWPITRWAARPTRMPRSTTLIRKYERKMPLQHRLVPAYRGEADHAFEWLDKAVKYHDAALGR